MNWPLLGAVVVLTTSAVYAPSARAECDAVGGQLEIDIACSASEDNGPIEISGPSSASNYEYLWLPSCPHANPESAQGSESLSCQGLNQCTDPAEVLMALWQREVPSGGWAVVDIGCRNLAELPNRIRTLTPADVLSAIRSIGLPTNQIHGPAYTLVNLDTTFSTTPHPLHRTLTILGYTVTINAQPTTYTWNWDDGTTTHTSTPGRPYPHTDITHTYTHPTDHQPPLTPSIDTTYHARYRVDHGPWTTIPDPITTHGPTHQLPVKQATAVLVQPD